jgi:hypothetical protein|tara:strand:+ start:847 stop:1269 length:423 start_codon:yes stop_codon:yes gene_type:complete
MLLRNSLSTNTLVTRVGLLTGKEIHDGVVVEDVLLSKQKDYLSFMFRAIEQDREKVLVGWCIMTMGTGISVPNEELKRVKEYVDKLDTVPEALQSLVVIDVMKSAGPEEAHLECYDLCNLFLAEGVPSVQSMKWSVDVDV